MCRLVFAIAVAACLASVQGATLERLTLEEMAQKSTSIVRGRIVSCTGAFRGSVIYTKCAATVAERLKGESSGRAEFIVPGGTVNGMTQTFTGTPKFDLGQEYVLFLWAGKSGVNQIIGLSQGIFRLTVDDKGSRTAKRNALEDTVLDHDGRLVTQGPVQLKWSELRSRVAQALQESR